MNKIGKAIKDSETYLKREDFYKNLHRKINSEKEQIKLGGGKKAIERQKGKGKLTARERINKLVDDEKSFFELSTFAGYGMYAEYGGAPSSGTIYGIGKINGKFHIIIANDATV
ncbi:MAG: carboxyl transferase domain-containing protein, partial [Ignavibacteriaceae bacterium]